MVSSSTFDEYLLSEILTAYGYYGSSIRGLIIGLLLRGYTLTRIIEILAIVCITPTVVDLTLALLEYGNRPSLVAKTLTELGYDSAEVACTLVEIVPGWDYLSCSPNAVTQHCVLTAACA